MGFNSAFKGLITNNLHFFFLLCRLYGFKIHPLAYQIQQQASSNFKAPLRALSYNNGGKRW